jgi:integrase
MKAKRERRVPLSPPAIAIVRRLNAIRRNEFVFPGERLNKPLSNMSMLMMLRRLDRDNMTVHGVRSTFRDWAAEQTNFSREVAEAALAHVIADRTEAAYRRGDLFEKRRRLMTAWVASRHLG